MMTGVNGMPELLGAVGGVIGTVIGDFSQRQLSPTEVERIEAVFQIAAPIIETKLKDGQQIRQDDFFAGSTYARSSGEEILEGVLQKVRNTYEDRKAGHFAKFWANIIFANTYSRHEANYLLALVESLTYNELVLLRVLASPSDFNLADIDYHLVKVVHPDTRLMAHSINRLANLNLIRMQVPGEINGRMILGTDLIHPSYLLLDIGGERLYRIFDLASIPDEDAHNTALWISKDKIRG